MSRCVLTRQTHWRHFQFCIFTLSKVIGKKPSVTPSDLRWPCGGHWETNTPGSSRIASHDMILRKLEWSDVYSRNRKHLNISPLTYNGEGHVIDLTLGHGLQNPRYTNCWLWWPHKILKVVKWSTTNCGCGNDLKVFLRLGHVTWPGSVTWPLIKFKFLHDMSNWSRNSHWKFGGAARRRFYAIAKKTPGGSQEHPSSGAG